MSAHWSVAPPLRLKELHGCQLMRANDGWFCDHVGLRSIEVILHLILYLTQSKRQQKCLKQEPYGPFAWTFLDARYPHCPVKRPSIRRSTLMSSRHLGRVRIWNLSPLVAHTEVIPAQVSYQWQRSARREFRELGGASTAGHWRRTPECKSGCGKLLSSGEFRQKGADAGVAVAKRRWGTGSYA
jgi:hypothetical protein